MVSRLTQKQVEHAKPGTSLSDGDGLFLKVSPKGSKSWFLRIQVQGKRSDIALGSFKFLTLSQARAKAFETRKAMKEGFDPKAEDEKRKVVNRRSKVGLTHIPCRFDNSEG